MAEHDRPIEGELVWAGDLRFAATSGSTAIVADGDAVAGPSPMQLLAEAVAGCMAIDVVTILKKGRHPLERLRVTFSGERAPQSPRRYVRITMAFHITGAVPGPAVERAIALSRATYCSVWHSMRTDIDFTITFDIHP